MKHLHADVLLGTFDTREEAENCLHEEAAILVKWKVTHKYRVFVEPLMRRGPWGVWLRTVKESK